MALTPRQEVRLLVQDTDVSFPFLSDAEVDYFLERNSNNVNRAALECAKVILLQLSLRSNTETVDIFSISGHRAANAYKDALVLFLRNPSLNPIFNGISGYAGGVSLADMQANVDNADNNAVVTPLAETTQQSLSFEL